MSKIEVGEYIRTNNGYIGKLVKKYKHGMIEFKDNEGIFVEGIIDIVKHSKNIIDLIQVGDYVNGMRVIETENKGRFNEETQTHEEVILTENYDEWTDNGVISNKEIKSIVTKEQFESIKYEVE